MQKKSQERRSSPEKKILHRTARVVPFSYGEKGEVFVYLQKKREDTRTPEKSGVWEFPGGKKDSPMKKGETPQEYSRREAAREMSEEMGFSLVDSSLLQFLGRKKTPLREENSFMETDYYLCPVDRGRDMVITQNNDELEKGEWILLSELPHFLSVDEDDQEKSKRKLNHHSFPPEFFSAKGEIKSEEEIKKIGRSFAERIYAALHSADMGKSVNAVFQKFTLENYIFGEVGEGTHNPDGELVTIADIISQYKNLSELDRDRLVEKIFSCPHKKTNGKNDAEKLPKHIEEFLADNDFKKGFSQFFETTKIKISKKQQEGFLGLSNWQEVLEFGKRQGEKNEIGFLMVLLLSGYKLWKTSNFYQIEKKGKAFRDYLDTWKKREKYDVVLEGEDTESIKINSEHSKTKEKTIVASLEKMVRKAEFLGEIPDILQARLVISKNGGGKRGLKEGSLFEFAKNRYEKMKEDSERFPEVTIEINEGNPSAGKRREVKILGKMFWEGHSRVPFEIQFMELGDLAENEGKKNHHKIYEIVRQREMKDRYPWLFEGMDMNELREEVIKIVESNLPASDEDANNIIQDSLRRVLETMYPIFEVKRDMRAMMRKRSFLHMHEGDLFNTMMEYFRKKIFGEKRENLTTGDLQLFLDDPIVFFRKKWRDQVNEIINKRELISVKRERIAKKRKDFERWREKTVTDISKALIIEISADRMQARVVKRCRKAGDTKGLIASDASVWPTMMTA